MKIIQYKIVHAEEAPLERAARNLATQVQALIDENAGWEPLGGVSISAVNNSLSSMRLAQAMVQIG